MRDIFSETKMLEVKSEIAISQHSLKCINPILLILFSIVKKRFRLKILEVVKSLSDMKMDYDQFVNDNVIPLKPFSRQGSQLFFQLIKDGDV
jgi:hypothetical protein